MNQAAAIDIPAIRQGSIRALSRGISLIAAGHPLPPEAAGTGQRAPVIGITGPPGAGKSTLTDALIGELVKYEKKLAALCVDPSSPFTGGAILGDRIRMSQWYNHPRVYIRSLGSRGALGGLPPSAADLICLTQTAGFDYILLETVGVGQSEVDITRLADLILVVLVPESGDDIQVMKAGLMEIADFFVVNKADRDGASIFIRQLEQEAASDGYTGKKRKLFSTVATRGEGVPELAKAIREQVAR